MKLALKWDVRGGTLAGCSRAVDTTSVGHELDGLFRRTEAERERGKEVAGKANRDVARIHSESQLTVLAWAQA
jgi:hypothetical protein